MRKAERTFEGKGRIIKEKVKEYLKAFDDLDNSIREIENAKGTERYSALLEELDKRMMNDENVPRDVSIIYESIYTDRFLHCPTGRIVTEYGNYKKRISIMSSLVRNFVSEKSHKSIMLR